MRYLLMYMTVLLICPASVLATQTESELTGYRLNTDVALAGPSFGVLKIVETSAYVDVIVILSPPIGSRLGILCHPQYPLAAPYLIISQSEVTIEGQGRQNTGMEVSEDRLSYEAIIPKHGRLSRDRADMFSIRMPKSALEEATVGLKTVSIGVTIKIPGVLYAEDSCRTTSIWIISDSIRLHKTTDMWDCSTSIGRNFFNKIITRE